MEFIRTTKVNLNKEEKNAIDMVLHIIDSMWEQSEEDEMEELWKNHIEWTKRSILTVAGMGKFSSDNSLDFFLNLINRIANYCQYIWNVQPLQEKTTEMKRTRSFPHLNSVPKDLHITH